MRDLKFNKGVVTKRTEGIKQMEERALQNKINGSCNKYYSYYKSNVNKDRIQREQARFSEIINSVDFKTKLPF